MTVDEPAHYEFQIAESLDHGWSKWFGGLELAQDDSGRTSMRGEMADQAALFGVLGKIRDLGLTLISLRRTHISLASRLPVGPSEQDAWKE